MESFVPDVSILCPLLARTHMFGKHVQEMAKLIPTQLGKLCPNQVIR
jgi:hypothetical protein